MIVYVIMYLAAAVCANLSVTIFGPTSAVINGFLFVGLDLSSRDRLHEAWKTGLWWKMALLILGGSVISYVLNQNALMVAIASCVAFAAAGLADTIIYHLLGGKAAMLKINGSNIVSAAVDSIVFPAIAFGGLDIRIVGGMLVAKIAGGFVWSLIIQWMRSREA